MKFSLRVVTTLAVLSGHPIRFSSVAAPDSDPDSIVIEPDPRAQISPGHSSRSIKGIAYTVGATYREGLMDVGAAPAQGAPSRPMSSAQTDRWPTQQSHCADPTLLSSSSGSTSARRSAEAVSRSRIQRCDWWRRGHGGQQTVRSRGRARAA